MNKTLVAYFSCTGNTRQVATNLAKAIDCDLYEITPKTPYTSADLDWQNAESRTSKEMNNIKSRPEIAGKISNMDEYKTIYVGFPIWWGIAPTIINTFLESYDFSGKTVIPFCTSGSSNADKVNLYLKPSCSAQTKWKKAKRFPVGTNKETLIKWVESLDIR